MAKFGARYIKFAPTTTAETDTAMPKYGTAVSMSKLVKVQDNPNYAEGKLYGDDELAEYANEFQDADVDVEVTDISSEMAAAILDAEKDSTSGDIGYGTDAGAPTGGLGFVSCKMVDNKKKYVGIFYTKVKATMQGEEYNTKGDTITFGTGKLKFKAMKPGKFLWKYESPEKDTFEDAKTWVDNKLKGTTAKT